MKLNDFLKVFNVQPPYFLRVMHHGTGSLYPIFKTSSLFDNHKEWLEASVVTLGARSHSTFSSLLMVVINV